MNPPTEANAAPSADHPDAAADANSPPRGKGRRGAPGTTSNAEESVGVRAFWASNVIFSRAYHRTIVRQPQRIPRRGPAILACNHISGLDPLLLQSVCPRPVVWMMAREYYEIAALTWVFQAINAIPVDRSGRDTAATRAALRALADGRVLGIFPEGKIETSRDLLPFQTGVAMLAIRTKVPVCPAYLDGTQRDMSMLRAFFTPNESTISFGPPVQFDRSSTSRQALEAATERIEAAVAALRPSPRVPLG